MNNISIRIKKTRTITIPALLLGLAAITFALSACSNTGANAAAQTAVPAAQPRFQVVGLGVNPATVSPGEEVQVVATITNTGNGEGEYAADLKINGVNDEMRTVVLPAGSSRDITFRLSRNAPQVYQVSLGEMAGQFEVNAQVANSLTPGASCCAPAGSGTPPAPASPPTASCCSTPGSVTTPASQPAVTQRRSCCQ